MSQDTEKGTNLEAFAKEVCKYHCWALGGKPCTLTSEQGDKLMLLGMKLAEQRGYDNGGTGSIGMHPSKEIPLVSYEMYLPDTHTWYTVVMLVNWEKSTARFYSAHTGTTWRYGCTHCRTLRAEYTPGSEHANK